MKPSIPKLKPTVYIEAVPELIAERRRLAESLAARALEVLRRHRVAAALALATLGAGLVAIA
jgi:hypothetical protein